MSKAAAQRRKGKRGYTAKMTTRGKKVRGAPSRLGNLPSLREGTGKAASSDTCLDEKNFFSKLLEKKVGIDFKKVRFGYTGGRPERTGDFGKTPQKIKREGGQA